MGQPIPPHVTMTNEAGAPVAPLRDNFLITWVDTYTLQVNGAAHVILNNKNSNHLGTRAHCSWSDWLSWAWSLCPIWLKQAQKCQPSFLLAHPQ